MSYLRGICGVNRMDGESNENVYRRFGMVSKGGGDSEAQHIKMVWTHGNRIDAGSVSE